MSNRENLVEIDGIINGAEAGYFRLINDSVTASIYHDPRIIRTTGETVHVKGRLIGYGNSVYIQADEITERLENAKQ